MLFEVFYNSNMLNTTYNISTPYLLNVIDVTNIILIVSWFGVIVAMNLVCPNNKQLLTSVKINVE